MIKIKCGTKDLMKVCGILETYQLSTLASWTEEVLFNVTHFLVISTAATVGVTKEEKENAVAAHLKQFIVNL